MRQRIAALACALTLASASPVWALPHYELEIELELTGESPVEANFERHFEQKLEFRKPSMQHRLGKYLKARKVRNPSYYADLICRQNATTEEKAILAGMLPVESGGDPNAVSCKGATGPWQVMPFWKKALGIKGSLKNPEVNIVAALRVYRIHLEDARGRKNRALVLYSGGARGYVEKIRAAKIALLS